MRLTPNRVAAAICVYFVVLALAYAQALPLFEATDEAAHFLYIHNWLKSGQLPVMSSRDALVYNAQATERWSLEKHQPPLYYLIGAALVSWTQRNDINAYLQPNPLVFIRQLPTPNVWLHPPPSSLNPGVSISTFDAINDTAVAAWVLRCYSIVLAVGTLWFIYRAGREAFSARVGLLAMLLVASIPMFVSLSASINNDNLVIFLYTVGVWWVLRVWRQANLTLHEPDDRSRGNLSGRPYRITHGEIIVISVILAAAALSKLTGLTLFGVVYLALVIGAARGRLVGRQVVLVMGVSLVMAAVLAGWWYVRNWTLYDDPFASKETAALMGRSFTLASQSGSLALEVPRIWQTFWLGIGHLHALVYGPGWLYVFAGGVCAVGAVGVLRAWVTMPERRDVLVLLVVILGVNVAALLVGTRDIDISYGRILYPALAALALLLVVGWINLTSFIQNRHRRGDLIGRPYSPHVYAAVLILPLGVMALVVPVQTLPDAYPQLEVVDALPAAARLVNAQAGGLRLLGYSFEDTVVHPGDAVRAWLYIQGQEPSDPELSVTLWENRGGFHALSNLELYPGEAPTAQLDPQTIYRVLLVFHIDTDMRSPRQLQLLIHWQNPTTGGELAWMDGQGNPLDTLSLSGPILIDPNDHSRQDYVTAGTLQPADVTYGDAIQLTGYFLQRRKDYQTFTGVSAAVEVNPGDTLRVNLFWRYLNHTPTDWTIAVGLLDDANQVMTHGDGMVDGYPTSLWQPAPDFLDERDLTIPTDTPPGEYRLYVGWYRLDTGERLTPKGDGVDGTLYIAPTKVQVVK